MEVNRTPILKIEDFLIATIQGNLHDVQAMEFKDALLQRIYDTKAKGVVLDLTAVDVLDSFVGRLINDIAQMSNLMGAKVAITGLQPAVAITMIELGLELTKVLTALNLEKGIARLRQATEQSSNGRA